MQNLVGVGVADSAEDSRIRERALECVVFAQKRRAKLLRVGRADFQTTGIVSLELLGATDDVQRGAFLRPRLRELQRARCKARTMRP